MRFLSGRLPLYLDSRVGNSGRHHVLSEGDLGVGATFFFSFHIRMRPALPKPPARSWRKSVDSGSIYY